MASVTSLDADMRKLRMERYTPQAAAEVRAWIESTLGEQLMAGDVLDALKDGVALCQLANMVLPPPGIRFKRSAMPFVQRENISHFLTACEMPPLNMPSHDRFLTVDLYDNKDPAQVIQCIQAFSRAANAVAPQRFREVIGPRRAGAPSAPATPKRNGGASVAVDSFGVDGRSRGFSNASLGSEPSATAFASSNFRSPNTAAKAMSPNVTGGSGVSKSGAGSVSSWSRRADEHVTAPAWNIHQYGYMGGASQGNQGVSFGARRQIIAPGVDVPNREEKVRLRQQKAEEEEKQKLDAEKARLAEIRAEEERAQIEEQRKWEEATAKAREKERAAAEAEKRKWEEEELRWKREEEDRKRREEQEMQKQISSTLATPEPEQRRTSESDRIKELERQLEEAKERERKYLLGREQRGAGSTITASSTDFNTVPAKAVGLSPATEKIPSRQNDEFETGDERNFLRRQHAELQTSSPASNFSTPPPKPPSHSPRPLPDPRSASPTRPLPNPTSSKPQESLAPSTPSKSSTTDVSEQSNSTYSSPAAPSSTRTDRFLSSNPAPLAAKPQQHFAREMGFTSTNERAEEDKRRVESQQKTKAGGWASKSLLEREMERERERQKEWEEQQMQKGRLIGPRTMGGRS